MTDQKPDSEMPTDQETHADLDNIFESIEKIGEKHGITELVFVFKLPDDSQPYMFFRNGNNNHYYDAAVLLTSAAKNLKLKIISELE